jgi:S-adenosylmethionine synthetase
MTPSFDLVISPLIAVDEIEVVERKGAGHPDTICDALAETFSLNLCREYQRRNGRVLHHNVDKALLCGGRAVPALGGGEVTEPIRIFLAGRAVSAIGDDVIPIRDIDMSGPTPWFRRVRRICRRSSRAAIECRLRMIRRSVSAMLR